MKNTPTGNNEAANERTLQRNKWYKQLNNPIWRLICPMYHLTAHLNDHSISPKFLLLTALTDPLHNDSIELYKALEMVSANVIHVFTFLIPRRMMFY